MKRITDFLKMICAVVSFLVLVFMAGCKTTKSIVDEQEAYNKSQENVVSVEQGGGVQSIDQLTVQQWFMQWYELQQQQHLQQDTEHIQETITTTTDSAGVTTKTEQRTTNRSTASQTTQSATSSGQEYKSTIDSLSSRIEALELKISDMYSIEEDKSKAKQTEKESKSLFTFPTWLVLIITAVLGIGFYWLFRRISR